MDKIIPYLKWEDFKGILKEKNISLFTLVDLKRIFPQREDSLKRFLSRQTNKRRLVRLKRGLYSLQEKIPDELIIAGALYFPSYISLEFALSYYSIIPETVYSLTSVTTKPTREFVVLGKNFIYNKIKREAFSDYLVQKRNNASFFIASPEKALADYLYFVSLGFKNKNDRIVWTRVKEQKVKKILTDKFRLKPVQVKKLLS